jgi:hypothetical protein
MTSSAAQDEFNELMRDKGRESKHPEDRHHDSDNSDPESPGAEADYYEKVDTDDELDLPPDMRSNYYMPSIRSEANTGPKGVIADAQAFEQAKKQARRFTWKKNASEQQQYNVRTYRDEKGASSDEDEDGFLKQWRADRLAQLHNVGERIRSRTNSPTRRIYGGFPLVDPKGYMEAMDTTAAETVIVVFVYGDNADGDMVCSYIFLHVALQIADRLQSDATADFEACMREVAKRNDTTRFIKLHNSDAEMDPGVLPAVLAYRRGDKFADMFALHKQWPADSELSPVSLETSLRQ